MNMLKMPWHKRTQKEGQREIIFGRNSVRNASQAVFFPGIKLMCVHQAFRTKVISLKSFLILIEKNKKIRDVIRKGVQKLGFEVIDARDFDGIPKPGTAVLYGTHTKNIDLSEMQIEFGFFDFCGNLTEDVMEFINRCNFKIGADVVFTFAQPWRNSKLPGRINETESFLEAKEETEKIIRRKPWKTSTSNDDPRMKFNTALLYASLCRYRKEFVLSEGYHDSRCFMQTIILKVKSNRFDNFWAKIYTDATGKSPEFNEVIQETSTFSGWTSAALKFFSKQGIGAKLSDVRRFINDVRGMTAKNRKEFAEGVLGMNIGNSVPEITASDRIALRNLKKENLKKFGTRTLQIA